MVARSPPKDACHAFDKMCEQSLLLKETVNKVDRAMARLQELQSTVRGHNHNVCLGVNSSPRSASARGYMRMSVRCKQESLRRSESTKRASGGSNGAQANKCCQPFSSAETGSNIARGEWRRWSLPAALVQQAIDEILETSNFAKGVVNIFSDSTSNKLVQDPKTQQSAFNGVNLLEERREKDVQVDWKQGSVHRKICRYNNAQGYRKLIHRRVTPDNTEHLSIKAEQSILKTPPGKHQSQISCFQKEGLNGKCFLHRIDRLELGNADKKPAYRKGQKAVHKFRMVTPENKVKALSSRAASSFLEFRRKAEKQQLHARARVELSQAGARVQSQMNCANVCGKNVKSVASALVCCCTSPPSSIGEQKPLVKIDQITHKPWTAYPKLAKAILFPNPAFDPLPSDLHNNSRELAQNIRCMTFVERKSLSYRKGFDTPKLKESPLNKENVPLPGKMGTRKPLSNLNVPKLKKHSSPPKVPIRTPMKTPTRLFRQAPVVKASIASHPARNTPPSFANQKTPRKFPKLLSPSKNKSPKHYTSSKKPVWFHRSHIASPSTSSPVICNISLLSKQLIHSPVQPLPSLISKLPSRKKRNSSPMSNAHIDLEKKVEPYPVEEGVPNETVETKGSVSGRVLPLHPAWVETLPPACMKPSNPKYNNLSLDKIPCENSVLHRGRSISCPKQRPLKPIEDITNLCGNRISNVSASGAELAMRRKDQQSEGKETKIGREEEVAHDTILKKPNTILKRSWSFEHENAVLLRNRKLNNSAGGGLPFLKYVRGFINMYKTASNINDDTMAVDDKGV